jgi:uncharacterized damage-inducible protein DinB
MDDELSTIREHLARFRQVTLQALQRTPQEKLSWAPAPGLMTFAGQYAHLAKIEQLYVRGLSVNVWAAASNELTGPSTITELRQMLDVSRSATEQWLSQLQPTRLDEIVTVPWLPVKWSMRSWLWYLVEHELHHKGQISLYLHLCGIEAPFFAFPLPPGIRPDKRPVQPR